jgi:hypothetical protein
MYEDFVDFLGLYDTATSRTIADEVILPCHSRVTRPIPDSCMR